MPIGGHFDVAKWMYLGHSPEQYSAAHCSTFVFKFTTVGPTLFLAKLVFDGPHVGIIPLADCGRVAKTKVPEEDPLVRGCVKK